MDRDYKWFIENYSEIYKQYGQSFVVIKNQTVIGSYPTYAEGVKRTCESEPLGTFIVQDCTEPEFTCVAQITSMNFLL